MYSRRFILACTLALAPVVLPVPLTAQSIAGAYQTQGPDGTVRLTFQQTGQEVLGELHGVDGSVLELRGTMENGRVTGAIQVAGEKGWFAAGFEPGGQLMLLVAEIDPTTGNPDLERGWSLYFDPVSGAGAPAAPGGMDTPGPGGAGQAGPEGMGAPSQSPQASSQQLSPQAREWFQHLAGMRLTYLESSGGSSYGSYSQSSERWDAYLCSDGSFYFESSSSFAVGGQGATGYGGGDDAQQGQWELGEQAGQIYLQYRMQDGSGDVVPLRYADGATYFGEQRVYVTPENPYCR